MTTSAAPPSSASVPTNSRFSGLAWSALILGIIGIVGSPIIIFNNLTAVAAAVGVILGGIALFGTRRILAGTGTALCIAAIAITVAAQDSAVKEIDEHFGGNDESAKADVSASDCEVIEEFGHTAHATVTITNHTDHTQSYFATISVNGADGNRLGEINVVSNSVTAGQSVTLTGTDATGLVGEDTPTGPATCVVAKVTRFSS